MYSECHQDTICGGKEILLASTNLFSFPTKFEMYAYKRILVYLYRTSIIMLLHKSVWITLYSSLRALFILTVVVYLAEAPTPVWG